MISNKARGNRDLVYGRPSPRSSLTGGGGRGGGGGISAGYLYSSRQKVITHEDGKQKTHDDFELQPFKISYIAELQLGPVKLYGSLTSKSMFRKGLDQTPYNFGIRLSNW